MMEDSTKEKSGLGEGRDEDYLSWRNSTDAVVLNVGGQRFPFSWSQMSRIPGSRLANLAAATSPKQLLRYCDGYNSKDNELVFNSPFFNLGIILRIYKENRFHIDADPGCPVSFEEDLNYWGIRKSNFDKCCQMKLKNSRTEWRKAMDPPGNSHSPADECSSELFDLWDDPGSSSLAFAIGIISNTCILLSILQMTLETIPRYKDTEWTILGQFALFFIMETGYTIFFTIELAVRFLSCPNKSHFVGSFMNWVDLVAILPYVYFLAMSAYIGSGHSMVAGSILKILRCVRILRLLRIFTKSRSAGVRAIYNCLTGNVQTLGLLSLVIFMGTIMFAALVYIAENPDGTENEMFDTMCDAYWWALITMTTVGYGEKYPKSGWGRFIAACCGVFGVLMLGLPITIIGKDFHSHFKLEQQKQLLSGRARKKMFAKRVKTINTFQVKKLK